MLQQDAVALGGIVHQHMRKQMIPITSYKRGSLG